MTTLRLDDLKQYSDVLRARDGNPVTVRFVEPRDAEELQNYFRSLSTRSRYNRFLGAMSELPHDRARSFHPRRRARRIQRVATMKIDGFETIVGEARYAFHPDSESSNSASRSTTAGRARASARRCCGIWNAAPPRSAPSACSATPCAPTTP